MLMRLVQDMFIYFIRNNIEIILLRQICNDRQFFPGEYLATWIGRITQDQRLYTRLSERILQHIRIEGKAGGTSGT